jgi:putative ABC transport system permease protein
MVANSAAVLTVARAADLAAVRLEGATRGHVVVLAAIEAAAATFIGGALGVGAGAVVAMGLRRIMEGLDGPSMVSVPWLLTGALSAAAVVIASSASAAAAFASQRVPPQALLGGRGG